MSDIAEMSMIFVAIIAIALGACFAADWWIKRTAYRPDEQKAKEAKP